MPIENEQGSACKKGCFLPSLKAFPFLPAPELLSQRPVYSGHVEEGRVKRSIKTGQVSHPC
jgi:hypothetical protein